MKSASSAASGAFSSLSNTASSALSSGSTAASGAFSSATATSQGNGTGLHAGRSTVGILFTAVATIITLLALVVATVYFTGYADDVAEWWTRRYYKAKAIVEVKVMENAGSEKLEGMGKDSLGKNPLVSEAERKKVSGNMGNEAVPAQEDLGHGSQHLFSDAVH